MREQEPKAMIDPPLDASAREIRNRFLTQLGFTPSEREQILNASISRSLPINEAHHKEHVSDSTAQTSQTLSASTRQREHTPALPKRLSCNMTDEEIRVLIANNPPLWAEPVPWKCAIAAIWEALFDARRRGRECQGANLGQDYSSQGSWNIHEALRMFAAGKCTEHAREQVMQRETKERKLRGGSCPGLRGAELNAVLSAYERARFQPARRGTIMGPARG